MKTTENISLAGYAFIIETDAFEELEAYLTDIRTCFSGDASADEIVADIEERIAELLREKCSSGMVADISMVQEIKKRIGNPQQLASEDTETSFEQKENIQEHQNTERKSETKPWKNKHLYRNIDDRVLGGVCSGLGIYLDIDKVLFRILFLIFFLIGFLGIDDGPYFGFSILAYLCLWIAMPAARTDDQKREMKGRPTDLKGYRDLGSNFSKEINEVAQSPAAKTAKRAGGIFLGIILLLAGLSAMFGCVIIPSIPNIIFHEMMEDVKTYGPLGQDGQFMLDTFGNFSTMWILILINVGLIAVWILYGAIMLLFDLKAPSWRPGLVIFIAWVMSVFVTLAYFVKMAADAIPTFML